MNLQKGLKERNASNIMAVVTFRLIVPNRKTLTIIEAEEIKALEEENSNEEFVDENYTLVTADVVK